MAITLFYVGIPVVGIIAIAYAIVCCVKMSNESPEKMNRETEEFMERFIMKLACSETVILIFVISISVMLWRSVATLDPSVHAFIRGAVYLITWLDLVMMAFTFALTYQLKLSRGGQQ